MVMIDSKLSLLPKSEVLEDPRMSYDQGNNEHALLNSSSYKNDCGLLTLGQLTV